MENVKYLINGIEVELRLKKNSLESRKLQAGTDQEFIIQYFLELIRNGELEEHGFNREHDSQDVFVEKSLENDDISETVEEHTVDIMEQLISLVEQHPPLYNFQLPLAERSKTIKDMLWKDIYEAMGGCITLQELPKKWKALRDRYLRLKGKKQPSGSGATADHTWKYYKQMNFVDLAAETQETTSSIPPDPTTPTSIPQSSLSSKKKKQNEENDDRFFKAIENINKSNLDEVDHFALRLSSGLRRLPAETRSKLEINFLQQLHDAEFNSF